MLKSLFISSVSASFEWQNNLAHYAEKEYTVYLDGSPVFTGNTNVFSLMSLTPDREYALTTSLSDEVYRFRTASEAAAFSALDFGARGDGVTDDTIALQTAINCLPKGARLLLPKGTYLSGPLCLKSHMTLHLAEGATILGIPDKSKFPVIPGIVSDAHTGATHYTGTWEGNAVPMHQALIFAAHAEDITIVGPGTIDGNAEATGWWIDVKKQPYGRPRLCFFNRCSDVHVHAIVAQNAASWQLHPYFSNNVDFIDVEINAPKDSPNTDAIDPEACDYVNIIGCRFSVGDDCIAIKSGKIEIGRELKTPANHHTIRNCIMQFGHGAVTLGSEMAGGVKNLTVNRCVFHRTDRGLRIKTRRGRGKDAVIDGVLFENIKMEGVLTPIVINMWYNCCDPDCHSEYVWSREKLPVDERTPYLGSFAFRDMVCEDVEVAACYCDGIPEMPINEITLENIHFGYSKDATPGLPAMREFMEAHCRTGIYIDNVNTLRIKNVTLDGVNGEKYVIGNVGKTILE